MKVAETLGTNTYSTLFSPDSSYAAFSTTESSQYARNILQFVVFDIQSEMEVYSESLREGSIRWENDTILIAKETMGIASPDGNGLTQYTINMKTGKKQLLNEVNDEEK